MRIENLVQMNEVCAEVGDLAVDLTTTLPEYQEDPQFREGARAALMASRRALETIITQHLATASPRNACADARSTAEMKHYYHDALCREQEHRQVLEERIENIEERLECGGRFDVSPDEYVKPEWRCRCWCITPDGPCGKPATWKLDLLPGADFNRWCDYHRPPDYDQTVVPFYLGSYLRRWRQSTGHSFVDVAFALKHPGINVKAIENNSRDIDVELLIEWCKILGRWESIEKEKAE